MQLASKLDLSIRMQNAECSGFSLSLFSIGQKHIAVRQGHLRHLVFECPRQLFLRICVGEHRSLFGWEVALTGKIQNKLHLIDIYD